MTGYTDVRRQLASLADHLAIAVAVFLPWSTSVATILGWIWLFAVVPTLDPRLLLQTLARPACALPLALFAFGLIAMAWADVSWFDCYYGFDSFHKLLAIPLLMVQFQQSAHGYRVLAGFIISASVLLVGSWILAIGQFPPLPNKTFGVLVKDRIAQGTIFTLCMCFLLELATQALARGQRRDAVASFALAAAFFLNIMFVTLSRTALVTVPILLAMFAARHLRWRQTAMVLAALVVTGLIVWFSSPALRDRVIQIPTEIEMFDAQARDTSAGARVAFWKTAIEIMDQAPVFGHGTGSINAEFSRVAGQPSSATNPHNQIFAVGIQLGLVGVALLIAMWCAHGWLFLAPGLAAWVGLAVVVENLIGSMFNSALFDFTQGWIYVFGVGIAGAAVLTRRGREAVHGAPFVVGA
jgi:O-antigen ligase